MRDKVTRQCPQTTTFEEKGEPKQIRTEVLPLTSLMPYQLGQTGSRRLLECCFKTVLNWANVCSPNILRTVQRTMIRFLIELSVRRTWFGQSKTLLRSQLACNEMQASARTCGRRAADAEHDRKCRLNSSQYTLIIPHRLIQLTTVSFWVSETRLRLPQVNK